MDIPHTTIDGEIVLKVLAATALLCLLFQGGSLPFAVMAAPLLFSAAFAVAAGGRRGVVMVLLLFSLVFCARYRCQMRTSVSLPFPEDQIRAVEIRLLSEPGWDSRGDVRLSGELCSVVSSRGVAGTASGACTVKLTSDRCPSPRHWYRGDRLMIDGKMAELRGRGSRLFFGRRVLSLVREEPSTLRICIHRFIRWKAGLLGSHSRVLLPALVLGQRDPRLEETALLFRETGTAHILTDITNDGIFTPHFPYTKHYTTEKLHYNEAKNEKVWED